MSLSNPTPTTVSWRRCRVTDGPLGPLGGEKPVGFSPDGVPDRIVAEAIRVTLPMPGTDYDWDAPAELKTRGRQLLDRPTALRPRPGKGSRRRHLRRRRTTTEQARLGLVSAAAPRRCPPARDDHCRGHDRGQQCAQRAHRRAGVELEYALPGPDGAPVAVADWCPTTSPSPPSWRNLRFARSQIPSDASRFALSPRIFR